ncbi:PQQ-binding-like beta-propeller repeat protein [Natronosalvus caseinilyticus]|uniref:outer membrane protein assembly factor BamB family protein n=1 Tax=Natronosalvus caseinilyticus TaxID=2953747 RepID=UPI0028AE7E41|nr:PQQ-binding-like beta-propeller repeat protein [Natronosalvus caseinilyticus]
MSLWPRRTVMALGASLVIGSFLGAAETSSGADANSTIPMVVTPADADHWASYHGTPGNTAAISGSSRFPAPEIVAWEYDQDGDVVVADGTVYLRKGDGVHALSASDGSLRWAREDVGADGTPAVVDDTVYVTGDRVTALDADSGDTVWSTSFGTDGRIPSPTVVDGSIYVVVDGALRSLDANDGSPRWRRSGVDLERRDADAATFASIPVAVANDLVYAAVGDAGFVALGAESGEPVWAVQEETPSRGEGLPSIVATEDRLYVAWLGDGGDGGVDDGDDEGVDGDRNEGEEEEACLVLDADDGAVLERVELRFPLAATDTVRVSAERHGVNAYNYETDHSWTVGGSIDAWGRPSIGGRTVVVPYHPTDGSPALFGVDIETGLEQWSFPLAAVGLEDPHEARWPDFTYVIGDGTVYLSGEGSLVALEPATEVGANEAGADEDDAVGADTMDADEAGDADDSSSATESDDETREDDTDATAFDHTDHEMDVENDASNEEDGAPGFTVSAGLVSGGLVLEWLRRRIPANDSEQ